MQTTNRMIAIFGLLLTVAVGCNYKNGAPASSRATGNVAIIDLDQVAKQLGYDQQIASAIEQQKSALNERLKVIAASFEQELAKRKEQVGDTPTEQQAQYLEKSQQAAVDSLNQQKKAAITNLNQYGAQVIQEFRKNVKEVAQQVAAEKGLSVILTKNDSVVFAHDTTVDITNAVAERMRAEQPRAAAPSETQNNPSATTP